jgi:hypothetical protein
MPAKAASDSVWWALEQADFLVVPSRYVRQAYLRAGFSPDRLRQIPNPIELPPTPLRWAGSQPRLRFGFLGQVVWHKGVRLLVEAWRHSQIGRDGRAELFITGAGPDWQTVAQLAANDPSIHQRPERLAHDEGLAFIDSLDCLILPSLWPENQPMVLLEAMARGKAVIGPDSGGVPELIQHAHNGWLFQPGWPDDLARALRAASSAALPEMGRLGRRAAELHDADRHVAQIETLLEGAPLQPRRKDVLVVGCAGIFPAEARVAVNLLAAHSPLGRIRFLWLDAAGLPDAPLDVLWILTPGTLESATRQGLPILMPESDPRADFVLRQSSGLTWRTTADAVGALTLWRDDSALVAAMTARAKQP